MIHNNTQFMHIHNRTGDFGYLGFLQGAKYSCILVKAGRKISFVTTVVMLLHLCSLPLHTVENG